jgi:hypothetical protein
MGTTVGSELGPSPVCIAGLQSEAGQLSHEVEFGRPDVAARAPGHPRLSAVIEREVVRHDVLAQNIVDVHADVAGLAIEDHCMLAGRELAQLRHPQLDYEATAGYEVPGRVTEALNLLLLSLEVGDRVVDDVDERVYSPGATAVAMSPMMTGIVASSALVRDWSIIGRDRSIPVTGTPRWESGTATRPVPMPNSSARPPPASSARRSTLEPSTSAANKPMPGVS